MGLDENTEPDDRERPIPAGAPPGALGKHGGDRRFAASQRDPRPHDERPVILPVPDCSIGFFDPSLEEHDLGQLRAGRHAPRLPARLGELDDGEVKLLLGTRQVAVGGGRLGTARRAERRGGRLAPAGGDSVDYL